MIGSILSTIGAIIAKVAPILLKTGKIAVKVISAAGKGAKALGSMLTTKLTPVVGASAAKIIGKSIPMATSIAGNIAAQKFTSAINKSAMPNFAKNLSKQAVNAADIAWQLSLI